jgi:hypothetical protein
VATNEQRAYAVRAAEAARARRAVRRLQLMDRRVALLRTCQVLTRVRERSAIANCVIGQEFIWNPHQGAAAVPPLAQLVRTSEEALRLYLTALFVAQALGRPGRPPPPFASILDRHPGSALTWPTMLGLPTNLTLRNSRLRVHRAMRRLEDLGLATIPTVGGRPDYTRFQLLSQDGSGDTYILPGSRYTNLNARRAIKDAVALPATFWTRGWNAVLNGREIACLLMLWHTSHRYRDPRLVFVPRANRLNTYCLSDEIYSAHRELAEFGLVRHLEPMLGRRRGRLRYEERQAPIPTFRFELQWPHEDWFDRVAATVVIRRLSLRQTSPHLRRTEALTHTMGSAFRGSDYEQVLEDDDGLRMRLSRYMVAYDSSQFEDVDHPEEPF